MHKRLEELGAQFVGGVAYLQGQEVGRWAGGVFYLEPGVELPEAAAPTPPPAPAPAPRASKKAAAAAPPPATEPPPAAEPAAEAPAGNTDAETLAMLAALDEFK